MLFFIKQTKRNRVFSIPPQALKKNPSQSSMIYWKMENTVGTIVCLVIMVMDIVAGVLGIVAESAQKKEKHMRVWMFECREPSQLAYKLGLTAAILMALTQLIANLTGGCFCFKSRQEITQKPSANKQMAIITLIFSWVIFAVGFTMLIIGTMANSKSRKSCAFAHHGPLSIGGILCFIHGLFALAYYVSAVATARERRMMNQGTQT